MFEKSQIICDYFGTAVFTNQKLFLARTRLTQQPEKLLSSRRIVKSTEMKNQMDGKGQKKSLKKRSGNFIHSDRRSSNCSDLLKQDTLRQSSLTQTTYNKKNSLQKNQQTSNLTQRNLITFNYSSWDNSIRNSQLPLSHRQRTESKQPNLQAIYIPSSLVTQTTKQKENQRNKPQSIRFSKDSIQATQFRIPSLKQYAGQDYQKPPGSTHEITFMEHSKHSTPYQSQKCFRLSNQNWLLPNQNSFSLQQCQQLYQNEQQIRSLYNWHIQTKNSHNLRQLHKSKKIQHQQQLLGRFAQSENQSYQESLKSEVIGKSFDHEYRTNLESDDIFMGLQSKASQSTNIKLSNDRGEEYLSFYPQKSRFQNLFHFTSRNKL